MGNLIVISIPNPPLRGAGGCTDGDRCDSKVPSCKNTAQRGRELFTKSCWIAAIDP